MPAHTADANPFASLLAQQQENDAAPTRAELDQFVASLSKYDRMTIAFDIIIDDESKTRMCYQRWTPNTFSAFLAGVQAMLRGSLQTEQLETGVNARFVPAIGIPAFGTMLPAILVLMGTKLSDETEKFRIVAALDVFCHEDASMPHVQREMEAIANQQFTPWYFFSTQVLDEKKRELGLV